MIPSFSSTKYLTGYSVYLLDESGDKIKISKSLPEEDIIWKGTDINKNIVPDGLDGGTSRGE